MTHFLSKSKIISGRQCPKRLFLEAHKPEAADASEQTSRVLSRGLEVHEVARTLYPRGRLIEHDNELSLALKETREALKDWQGEPVFEATLVHEGVLVRADILRRDNIGVQLVEVKSSTSVKEYHVEDAAIQTWVFEGQGIKLDSVAIAVIERSFIYLGNGGYWGLFQNEDVTERVRSVINEVPGWVQEFRQVLSGPEPGIEIGKQCSRPFACPFIGYCSEGIEQPEYPVSVLPNWGGIVERLRAEGYEDLREVPEDLLSNPTHRRIRRACLSGRAIFDAAVADYMKALPYPRYHLDFEAIDFVVPIWIGTSPYQHIPFQWSCHIEEMPGQVTHAEFLHDSADSPARPFAESLLDTLGDSGPIFVYSGYESRIIKGLSTMMWDLKERLEKLLPRLEDLLPLARKHYYHPSMKGSWSIKAILGSIAPDLSYTQLEEVRDGTGAQIAYEEMIAPDTPEDRRTQLHERLLKYCELDTLALVKLADFFQSQGS